MFGLFQRWIVLKGTRFGALACGDFRLFTFGNSLSLVGTWVQRIGTGWLAWESSHSSAWLGLLAFADLFPTVLLAPVAGVIADRCDKRRVIVYCQFVAMGTAVLQACLILSHANSMAWLLAVTLVSGIASALCQPARLSWISTLVPPQRLASAVAINSLCFNLARFAGPALAGAMLLKLDPSALFLLNALSYAIFIVIIFRIAPGVSKSVAKDPPSHWLRGMTEGFRYLVSDAPLRETFLILTASAVCIRGVPDLAPAIAGELLQRGSQGFASLVAAAGLGAIAGGVWCSGRDTAKPLARLIERQVLAASLCTLALALTHDFRLALALFLAMGFSIVVTGIGAQTFIHLSVPQELRGRVLALYGVVYRGGPALSALWLGAGAPFLGLRLALGVGALLCMAAYCVMAIRVRARARRQDPPAQ
ncbi:MFS transporter [Paraburkholderia fungorum]|uniref:MFS transporter n=1 Tax=Paraburkholderia fungorum TaxID=134537 RepID=UPI0038B90522